jgi:hypothetical protein
VGQRVEALTRAAALAIALERRLDAVACERAGLAARGDDLDVVAVPCLGDVEASLTERLQNLGRRLDVVCVETGAGRDRLRRKHAGEERKRNQRSA